MIEKMNNYESRYFSKGSINLNTIPTEDCELALMAFSGESIGLIKCLRAMWQRNLKTHSCHVDYNNPQDIAYIKMEKNIDIFSYLSERILTDDMIQINYVDEKEIIIFSGTRERIEGALLALARDIQTGRKHNIELLKEKLYKPFIAEYEKQDNIKIKKLSINR